MSKTFRADFANPPAAWRGKPLWAWNSRLEKRELLRQVRVFAEMGMGGYFMHSRVGLDTPYLSKEWFQLIRACAAEGEKLGLESWLYDEDRWPSGSAGGLVTREPEFRMRYLRAEFADSGRHLEGRPLTAAFAVKVKGLILSGSRRLASVNAALHPGERLLVFGEELVRPHGFFNDGTYLDTLNPAAVNRFLQLTHERYQTACGPRFGKSIPGIFTDEPHRGFVMADTPEGWTYPPESRWVTPWTESLAADFTKQFGYDLLDHLPALFLIEPRKRISPVKWHYMETLHRRFLESWGRTCHDWCRQHGLRLTGHMLGEESPSAQALTCGSAMRYYEHLDVPGMDLLGRNNRAFWIARQVASVARQQGRQWTMSELYGCTGWQTTFADHKEIGDWQAFYGINLRCHHLSWYTMAGEAKRDFPASIFFQSNWYREYRAVEDYYARLHLLLQQGEVVCDLLVLHPVESIWAQVHVGWGGWIKSQSAGAARLDRIFETTFRWITAAGVDFDYGDEEQLGRLGRVKKTGADSRLQLGRAAYRAVLVSGMETLRASTLRLLEAFQAAGGTVIFAGKPPACVEAVPSVAPRRLSRIAVRVPFNRPALTRALLAAVPPVARLVNARPGDLTRPVLIQTRRQGKDWIVAVANTDPAARYSNARLVFNGSGTQVQEWDCRTGKTYSVPYKSSTGSLEWDSPLAPLGEKIFRVCASPDRRLNPRRPASPRRWRSLPGPFAYSLDEPNAFVIDRFQWRLGRKPWQTEADILEIDRIVRNQLGLPQRSLGMIQPWARPRKAPAAGTPLFLKASFHSREAFSLELLLEQPERWQIRLNGKPLDAAQTQGWLIDPCFRRLPIPPGRVKAGENELTLMAEFREDLDLEAVYLLGSFGVYQRKGSPILDRLPARLEVGDAGAQGLPFYTGRIRYEIPLPANTPPARFRLPAFGGAAARLRFSEKSPDTILAFPPHETELPGGISSIGCEIILTRRNLFGPLHWKRGNHDFVAPDSFRSTGPAYSIRPLLEPSGLLTAPQIQIP